MSEPVTISPAPPTNPGLDYGELKREGTELLQRWAGEVWTDYNESDPGVTTLEQLAYALTELSYRAEIPLADLLTREVTERIDPQLQALYPANEILPVEPVTRHDYRKLFIDRLPEVRNAWLEPLPRQQAGGLRGLYRLDLWAPAIDDCHPEERQSLEENARRLYGAHRNLCEDLEKIRWLRPVPTEVAGEVLIGDRARPAQVLARLLFELGLFLAPEPRREPLSELLAAGRSPAEIFTGPWLEHGFIADRELQPKRSEIAVSELTRIVLGTAGVIGLGGPLVAYKRGVPHRETIPVGPHQILHLDTSLPNTLRLVRRGVVVEPDPRQVEHELEQLWERQRRTYPLAEEYRDLLPFPRGRYRPLKRYESVQNQYPKVYGIGADGLPAGASVARQGQARQLKGYLLAFEQLLTDFFAQLAAVKDLYSTAESDRTYYCQPLTASVPDVEPLLRRGYEAGLEAIVAAQDPFATRRNRFLAFLLSLAAESLDAASLVQLSPAGEEGEASDDKRITAQQRLLRHLVVSTAARGRGIDYLAPPSNQNYAGMQIKSRCRLGMRLAGPRPLEEVLADLGVVLDGVGRPRQRPLRQQREWIEAHFEVVPDLAEAALDGSPELLPLNALPRSFQVSGSLLDAVEDDLEVRLGSWPDETTVAAVWRAEGDPHWHLIGKFDDRDRALAGCGDFHRLLACLRWYGQQLLLVEHILLRFDRRDGSAEGATRSPAFPDPDEPVAEPAADDRKHPFPYSFTQTAVVVTSRRRCRDPAYREQVAEVLRQETPAHIVDRLCFVPFHHEGRFYDLYWRWRDALQSPADKHERARASAQLRRFLERCTRRGALRENGFDDDLGGDAP